jgi:uncharacterized membrane protein
MKKKHFLAAIFVALPVIYTAFTWATIPAIVPLHYSFTGDVDRTGPKSELLVFIGILTLVNALVYALLSNVHRIKTGLDTSANKGNMQMMALGIVFFITGVQLWILYHMRTALPLSSIKFLLIALGLLFSFIGNYMHTIKPNHFAGFRLPWTLRNGDNWRQTHHFASRVWFGGGLLCAGAGVLFSLNGALPVFGIILFLMLLLPLVYSYRLAKNAGTKTV